MLSHNIPALVIPDQEATTSDVSYRVSNMYGVHAHTSSSALSNSTIICSFKEAKGLTK